MRSWKVGWVVGVNIFTTNTDETNLLHALACSPKIFLKNLQAKRSNQTMKKPTAYVSRSGHKLSLNCDEVVSVNIFTLWLNRILYPLCYCVAILPQGGGGRI